MSEMIRQIAGIGSTTNVNYIPVVYYCRSTTAAATKVKEIQWAANSDDSVETQFVDSSKIPLYKGLTLAVLFTKGITYQSNITDSTAYKIKVGDDSYKIYLTSGELYQGDPKENIVLILEFTGSMFKVANGVARYLVDELAKRIQELELQRGGFVKLKQLVFPNDNDVSNAPVIDIYEQDTGGNSQFVYVKDSTVQESTLTLGSDIRPLKIVNGKLQKVGYDLVKKTEVEGLKEEIKEGVACGIKQQLNGPITGEYKLETFLVNNSAQPISAATVTFTVGDGNTDEKVKQTLAENGTNFYPVLTSDMVHNIDGAIPNTTVFTREAKLGYNTLLQPTKGVFITGGTAGNSGGTTSSGYKIYDTAAVTPVAVMWHAVKGTSETVGRGSMAVGNAVAEGNLGNARGAFYVYGTGTGRNMIMSNVTNSASPTNYLPAVSGFLAVGSTSGVGDSSHAVYMNSAGQLTTTTYDLSKFMSSTDDKYHNSGSYTFGAGSSATGGLTTIIRGNNVSDITLNIPIYWGINTPSLTGKPKGALYIQIDS